MTNSPTRPESGADYEFVVRQVLSTLTAACSGFVGVIIDGGRTHRIHGASGFGHQIDVSMRLPRHLLIIECKCWTRPVCAESVLALAARLHDIRASHPDILVTAALISMRAPSAGAVHLAQHFGIQLDQVLSGREFVLSLGPRHFGGIAAQLRIEDTVEATVQRGRGPTPEEQANGDSASAPEAKREASCG